MDICCTFKKHSAWVTQKNKNKKPTADAGDAGEQKKSSKLLRNK